MFGIVENLRDFFNNSMHLQKLKLNLFREKLRKVDVKRRIFRTTACPLYLCCAWFLWLQFWKGLRLAMTGATRRSKLITYYSWMTWNYSEIAENNQPDGIKLPDEQNVIKKMKEKFTKECLWILRLTLKSKLHARNKVIAINAWVVSVLRYGVGSLIKGMLKNWRAFIGWMKKK